MRERDFVRPGAVVMTVRARAFNLTRERQDWEADEDL